MSPILGRAAREGSLLAGRSEDVSTQGLREARGSGAARKVRVAARGLGGRLSGAGLRNARPEGNVPPL